MDAHENEYAAAADGMADVYGRSPAEHAVGDRLWFRLPDWEYARPGCVVEVSAAGLYVLKDDHGERFAVWSDDIMPF
jgi:hypothetical protein